MKGQITVKINWLPELFWRGKLTKGKKQLKVQKLEQFFEI